MSLHDARVLVVGDVLLDWELHGTLSHDATAIPLVAVERERTAPGGAASIAAQVAALGCPTTLVGILGDDSDSRRLRKAVAQAGVQRLELVEVAGLATPSRIRVVANSPTPLLQLDRNPSRARLENCAALLPGRLDPLLETHNVVVIADSDQGTISPALAAAVIARCRARRIPCVVTTSRDSHDPFAGATVLITPRQQAERQLGRSLDSGTEPAASEVCRSLGLDGLVVVDAWPRLTLVTAERVTQFASPVPEGADETAVIDFVTARLASALGAGHDLEEACRNASVPAVSAATSPTGETAGNEREEATRLTPHRKVCEPDEARRWLLRQKQAGRRVVFTNGCFDILHAGHVACLEEARRQGDLLVVGLNSDASVRLNKGPERPIISEQNRATLLAALACVDLVVLFDELTPELLVRHLEPEILVKGGDYANVPIAGADFVRSRGGGVVLIPLVEGLSTTRILEASRGHAN